MLNAEYHKRRAIRCQGRARKYESSASEAREMARDMESLNAWKAAREWYALASQFETIAESDRERAAHHWARAREARKAPVYA